MTQTLENLITKADSAFLGDVVLKQYGQEAATVCPDELLAQFLMAEILDLYDPDSSDSQNLRRIVSGLEMASDRLAYVAKCLRELQEALLA